MAPPKVSSFEISSKHTERFAKYRDDNDVDEPKNVYKSYCCCLVGIGIFLLLLYFVGIIHSTDSSCMQHGSLNFKIASRWKSEYGYVCCANHVAAEPSGWWKSNSNLVDIAKESDSNATIKFYDASCGKLLYEAPIGRSMTEFIKESKEHGWPSFRKAEIVQSNVNTREGGEVVSTCGTHLGHNLPDGKGTRHCINLLCVAGTPPN
jgi:hypothetical protein